MSLPLSTDSPVLLGDVRRWTRAITVRVVRYTDPSSLATVVVEDIETGRRSVHATAHAAAWELVARAAAGASRFEALRQVVADLLPADTGAYCVVSASTIGGGFDYIGFTDDIVDALAAAKVLAPHAVPCEEIKARTNDFRAGLTGQAGGAS